MAASVIPTKSNLMAQRRSLALSQMGYDLMDKKRNVLIREMMLLVDRAKRIQRQIDSTFGTAYAALEKANIALGLVQDVSREVEVEDSLTVQSRSVMGVEIPIVSIDRPVPATFAYSFMSTNPTLDEAYIDFLKVKYLCAELAEIENSLYRLGAAVKKTQKRANALQNIVIPQTSETIKHIASYLEEKDREEFTRLKVIKRSKQR